MSEAPEITDALVEKVRGQLGDDADRAWHRVRQAHEARVFLLALLLAGRVARR